MHTWKEQGDRVCACAYAYLFYSATTVWFNGIALRKAKKTWPTPLPTLTFKEMPGILQWYISRVMAKLAGAASFYMQLTMAHQDERC